MLIRRNALGEILTDVRLSRLRYELIVCRGFSQKQFDDYLSEYYPEVTA